MKVKELLENLRVYPSPHRAIHEVVVDDYDNDENMEEVASVLKKWPRNIRDVKISGRKLYVEVQEDKDRIRSRDDAVKLVNYLLKDHGLHVV